MELRVPGAQGAWGGGGGKGWCLGGPPCLRGLTSLGGQGHLRPPAGAFWACLHPRAPPASALGVWASGQPGGRPDRGAGFQLADRRSASYFETLGPTCLPVRRAESSISSWPVGVGHTGARQSESRGRAPGSRWGGRGGGAPGSGPQGPEECDSAPRLSCHQEGQRHLGLRAPQPGAVARDKCHPFSFARLPLLCPGPGCLTPRVLGAPRLQQVSGRP